MSVTNTAIRNHRIIFAKSLYKAIEAIMFMESNNLKEFSDDDVSIVRCL